MTDTQTYQPKSTPTILLTLDAFGAAVAEDIRQLFVQNDDARQAATIILALDDADGLTSLTPVPADSMLGKMMAGQAPLSAVLEESMRHLRTEQSLARAGLADMVNPPLDIFILGDLSQRKTAQALFPALLLVEELLEPDPYGEAHLLLNVARFTGEESDISASDLLVLLQGLEALRLADVATAKKMLQTWTEVHAWRPLSTQIYLFDASKEGGREVSDRVEMRIIMGNVLMAFMSAGLAQKMTTRVSEAALLELKSPFHSAGATMMGFAPQPVIDQCAARLGKAFIQEELLAESQPPGHVFSDWQENLEREMGGIRAWTMDAVAETPLEFHADERHMWLGLHFSGFDFDHVAPQRWADVIATYDVMFARTKAPKIQEMLNERIGKLKQRTLQQLNEALVALPQHPGLYPGGLNASRQILRSLDERMEARMAELEMKEKSLPDLEAQLARLAKESQDVPGIRPFLLRLFLLSVMVFYLVQMLSAALSSQTGLSVMAGWLAGGIAVLATVLAALFWLHRKERHLIELREACIRTAEARNAHRLEAYLRAELAELMQSLRSMVEKDRQRLYELEEALTTLVTESQLQQGVPSSPFRLQAADENFIDWAYQRWQPDLDTMRRALLEEQHLLAEWRTTSAETIRQRLLAFSRHQFEAIHALPLAEVLRHRRDEGRDVLSTLQRSATPLLRPDFDEIGGGRYAQLNQMVVLPLGGLAKSGHSTDENWEWVNGLHPHLLFALRVRHLLPLASLQSLQRRAARSAVQEETML